MMSHRQALSQPLLTAEEENLLIDQWRNNGDQIARDRLINSHMRLCYSVAAKYDKNEDHIRDLAQEGVFGLMKAIEKFDQSCGTRFATYARWWVMTSVSQSISRVAAVIDIPPRTFLEARGGGVDDESLPWEVRQAARGEVPLDAPVGDDGETTVIDMLHCPRPDPEANAMEIDRIAMYRRSVEEGMKKAMTPREAAVLKRRLLTERPETLEEIATNLGVSRERIRQIEAMAVEKLRKYLISSGFPKNMLR